MRHILRGALGVAVVYPLLWHYSSADVGGVPSTAAVAASERRGTERSPSDRSGVDQPLRAERAVTERLPAAPMREPVATVQPGAPEPALARAPASPQPPSVPEPRDPLAELGQIPELKETLARAAEIQRHAANPAELERAVQGLDEDPAKLARLKALADLLVQLPTPRGDAYLPASGRSPAGTPAR